MRHNPVLLAFSLVLSSFAQAVPAVAAQARALRVAPAPQAARVAAPLGAGLGQSFAVPGLGQLPASLIPTGIAAGPAESALRQAQTPAASLATPAASAAPAAAPITGAPVAASAQGPAAAIASQQAAAAPRSLLGRISQAVLGTIGLGQLFDSSRPARPFFAAQMGIRPLPTPNLPNGTRLDEAPASPDPRVVPSISFNAFEIPGARTTGGIFDNGARALQADPTDVGAIEAALRQMVDQESAKYGVTSADLQTVHVKRVAGQANQADTIYAYFRQQRAGVQVHGSYLSFTIKVIKGQPTVFAAMAQLYPALNVPTTPSMSDDQLKAQAEARIGIPPNSGVQLELIERKIIYSRGDWHTVNLYMIEGYPVMIAVDVVTGDTWAWDPRQGLLAGETTPEASAGGTLAARVETSDKRPNDQYALSQQPLPHLNVSVAGKTAVTDSAGKFSATGSGKIDFTASLSGKYAIINDRARQPVKVSASLTPGQDTTVVFNPTGEDEITVSQVNAYVAVNRVHDWVKARGIDDARLEQAIPVNVNINDECNAYYTPGRPSLNFFKSSANCSDTAKPGVVAHEWGHFMDDMLGGIVNGGLSEGWGDILSMYILGSPIVGEGFLKGRTPSWIRHGENDYQYGKWDEVHDQGQAWMGFAWKLRQALIVSLGEAAGAARAEALVVPTIYAKAADIPAAMAQVLLNAMDKDGNIQNEAEIRAAAKAHGIDLPKNPGAIATLWNALFGWMRG